MDEWSVEAVRVVNTLVGLSYERACEVLDEARELAAGAATVEDRLPPRRGSSTATVISGIYGSHPK